MSPVYPMQVLHGYFDEGCRTLGFSGGSLLLGGHSQSCQAPQCTMSLLLGAWGQGGFCWEPVPGQVSCPQGVGHSSCPCSWTVSPVLVAEHIVGWDRATMSPLLQPCPCCVTLL